MNGSSQRSNYRYIIILYLVFFYKVSVLFSQFLVKIPLQRDNTIEPF